MTFISINSRSLKIKTPWPPTKDFKGRGEPRGASFIIYLGDLQDKRQKEHIIQGSKRATTFLYYLSNTSQIKRGFDLEKGVVLRGKKLKGRSPGSEMSREASQRNLEIVALSICNWDRKNPWKVFKLPQLERVWP